jgi:inner membrane protein
MEPVTHILTGAVLARSGFNRRAAYATAAMAIAAEFPDIDTLWSLRGPLSGFEHHRGITHTFLGIPFEAALITAALYAWHQIRARRPQARPPNAPIRWLQLYLFTLLALLSHLFLDWTNNYGLRPFFPFNPRWYAGSFVFIVEPVILLLLFLALLAPWLFGLISAEVGERKQAFPGRGWAIFALLGIVALWVFRAGEHAKAIRLAADTPPLPADQTAAQPPPQPDRIFASPSPGDPFTWHLVVDTPGFYQLATVNTRTRIIEPPQPADTLYKPATTLPLLVAKRTWLGQIYLDWSQYPVLSESADTSDPTHPLAVVTFSDARFLYKTILMDGRTHTPLAGQVTLDMQAPEGSRVVETSMDNRIQR